LEEFRKLDEQIATANERIAECGSTVWLDTFENLGDDGLAGDLEAELFEDVACDKGVYLRLSRSSLHVNNVKD
jgi:sulfur transfer protein SufE